EFLGSGARFAASIWNRLTADEFTHRRRNRNVHDNGTTPRPAEDANAVSCDATRARTNHGTRRYFRRSRSGGQWVLDVWVRKPAGWRVTAVQVTNAKK